ncbi:MAG: methionyl-tRNA formyltransferase [Bacteroidetes bacterium]|jgi:methionyl-tRNA formyltransferase|nr:methionyl-tRNA formyltransferase [Bacteroidota bacterium]
MKIAIICNSDSLAFPTIGALLNNGWIAGVAILARNANTLYQPLVNTGINQQDILLLEKENWQRVLGDYLNSLNPDMVWVFGFPWRIPENILSIPPGGFLNFHFGNMPQYKGADPIFWQLKNGDDQANLIVHKMTASIDAGPIISKQELPIMKGENYGLFCRRLGYLAAELAEPLVNDYLNNKLNEWEQQPGDAPFFKKPGSKALTIHWGEQSAEEIECLVNAANPKYGGASTFLGDVELRILETSPAEIKTENGFRADPGTIVYADALYGLIVACREGQFLKINVVHTADGYFSGSKLFGMGIKTGVKFTNLN